MTERHKKALYAAAIAIFILFTLAVSWFVGRPLIRFVRQPEQFRAWVQGHGLLGQAQLRSDHQQSLQQCRSSDGLPARRV